MVTRVDVIVSLLSHRSSTSRRSWEDEAAATEGTTEAEDEVATEKALASASEGAAEGVAVVLCVYGNRGVAGEYGDDGRQRRWSTWRCRRTWRRAMDVIKLQ